MTPLTFIQISDTHLGASKDFLFKERNAFKYASKIVDRINSLPITPDFIVHTGDVATNCEEEAYVLAKGLFSKLKCPAYFVTGNHDVSSLIRKHLTFGEKIELFPGGDELSYTFSLKGFKFIVLDGRGDDAIDPHGVIKERTLGALREELSSTKVPVCIFTHFPAVAILAPWIDENARFLNWKPLHELLAEHRSIIRGVFIGHIHQSTQITADGITYTSAASSVFNFGSWPGDTEISMDPVTSPGLNVVTLTKDQTIVKQLSL